METIISPPTLTKKKCFEQFKQETLAWAEITDLEKGKQPIAVALNLQDNDEHKITEKVFDEIELDGLKNENGLSILSEFFDKHLAKDEMTDILEKFEDFDNFEREKGQPINEFVASLTLNIEKLTRNV